MRGFFKEGTTLNLMLYFCAKMYPKRIALVQGTVSYNYQEFYEKSSVLAVHLANNHELVHGDRVGLMAKNSLEMSLALFALSRVGVHVYLLNPEMTDGQLTKFIDQKNIDFIVCDEEQLRKVKTTTLKHAWLVLEGDLPETVAKMVCATSSQQLMRRKAGNVVVLTGGTTGDFKSTSRKQSVFDFLNPLIALIEEMQLHTFKSVYIPTPIYHGYGLAALIVSVLLGSEIHVTKGFNANEACELIEKNKIEVVTLVPIMLMRMLNENSVSLKSLERILSGGAPLSPGLIAQTTESLGLKLYNLYGTSEAGFCILGSPEDLSKYPDTVGRVIKGAKIRVHADAGIGELQTNSKWSMNSSKNSWVSTGDLAEINESNLVFLKGRNDSMIVSGGENVYPTDLENVLSFHEKIDAVAVIGIPDVEFGSRLKAFVSPKHQEEIEEPELREWLSGRVARYQMPVSIVFQDELPLSSIGKINKKLLK